MLATESTIVSLASPWSRLGEVDVSPLVSWLDAGGAKWPIIKGSQPNRVRMPAEANSIVDAVLRYIPGGKLEPHRACVARLMPGKSYEMHRDSQPPDWITRVHVPIVTNAGAWFVFEGGDRVHFEVGMAYSFDTLTPHNFGNDGDKPRIHLTFDVLRAT